MAPVKLWPEKRAEAIFWVVLGCILAPAAGGILLGPLDVIHAPGLIHHFPQAYTTLAGLFLSGLFFFVGGVVWLRTHRRPPPGPPTGP
jgi:hypothetical protein